MSIPCKMRPVGLESLAMGEYKQVDFLGSTGTQHIIGTTTHPISNQHIEMRAQAALPGNPAVSETAISSTVFSLQDFTGWVPYNYNNDPRNIRWDFPGEGAGQHYTAYDGIYDFSTYKKQEGNCYINGELVLSAISNSTENNIFGLFARVSFTSYNRGGQVAWVKVGDPGNYKLHLVAALDPAGIPCMFDLVSRQPFYNQGTGSDFIVGLTMKQALNLANLPAPTTGNTLTVSLPKEASLVQHNQKVKAALEAAAEKGWHIAAQYRDEFEDESILNKYAACKTVAEVKAANPDYLKDLTNDREWIYPLDSLTASRYFSGAPERWNVSKIKTRFLQLKTLDTWTFSYANATSIEVYCPEVTGIAQFAGDNAHLRYMKIYAPKTKTIYSIVWGNPNVDLDFEAPNLDNCTNFGGYNGYITHTSATKFMNSLPPWSSGTHNLKAFTVHIDGKTDPAFQEALTSLENRGWDVDVQWNGTPTAQASTFDMGTIIYAKIGEHELPDGTTEQRLDWGHYVTNWEERGYEQFRSLESAYEYFGLEQEVEE